MPDTRSPLFDRLTQLLHPVTSWVGRRLVSTSLAAVLVGVVASAPAWWWRRITSMGAAVTWGRLPMLSIVAGVTGLAWWAMRRWRAGGAARRRPVAERIPLYVHVGVLLVLAIAVAVGAGFGMWALLGQPHLDRAGVGAAGSNAAVWSVQNTFDAMKIVLSVVAGIGGVVALTVAYRKQDHGEAAEHRENTKLFNERFGKAADQLGSDSAAVRLAGVYAMGGLADDWADGRQTCIDVLCAYLRMPHTPPPQQVTDSADSPTPTAETNPDTMPVPVQRDAREEQQARHTVISLIRYHLLPAASDPRARPRWHGHHFNLRAATLDGGTLHKVEVPAGTTLDLSYATFSGGTVSFSGATFSAGTVSFRGATFSGGTVSFRGATFSGGRVNFGGAMFSSGEVDFGGATFSASKVSFMRATFSGGRVNFGGATFSGGEVDFRSATFSAGRADFLSVLFTGGRINFRSAKFSGGTVALSKPFEWRVPPEGLSGSEPGLEWPSPEKLDSINATARRL